MNPDRRQSFRRILELENRVRWQLDDVLPRSAHLDPMRPLLPTTLSGIDEHLLHCDEERRCLDQIRGHSYLRLFGLVEEFILPFVLDHVQERLESTDEEIRALLGFAEEEAKHIHLFRRFSERFAEDFGCSPPIVGPARDIAAAVLEHDALGVGLVVLQIEWMTQRHFTESVRDSAGLEPLFASLLRHHWIEESRHARLDTLMVETLAEQRSPSDIRRALEDYSNIARMLQSVLWKQVELDLYALQEIRGRALTSKEYDRITKVQRRSYEWTFWTSGSTHPEFRAVCERLERQ